MRRTSRFQSRGMAKIVRTTEFAKERTDSPRFAPLSGRIQRQESCRSQLGAPPAQITDTVDQGQGKSHGMHTMRMIETEQRRIDGDPGCLNASRVAGARSTLQSFYGGCERCTARSRPLESAEWYLCRHCNHSFQSTLNLSGCTQHRCVVFSRIATSTSTNTLNTVSIIPGKFSRIFKRDERDFCHNACVVQTRRPGGGKCECEQCITRFITSAQFAAYCHDRERTGT